MLKYIAILKDSFREAIDGWVFIVMVALSTVTILMVASLSAVPVDAEKAFSYITGRFGMVSANRGESIMPRNFFFIPQIKDLKKTNDATAPQEGDYRFILQIRDLEVEAANAKDGDEEKKDKPRPKGRQPFVMKSAFRKAVAFWNSNPQKASAIHDDPDPVGVTDEMAEEFIRDQFSTFGNMSVAKVKKLPSDSPDVFEFEIETKGMKGAKGWLHEPVILFGAWQPKFPDTLGSWVFMVQGNIVNGFGAWVTILISVVITAFFIPNMMRKGAVDLLLSKPIQRPLLLLYKYIGGLTFVFLNTSYAVGGIWLVVGLRTGIWSTGFLLSIFAITFYFAILYAVSTLIGVATRNAIVAILVTVGFWFMLYLAGSFYMAMDMMRNEPSIKKEMPEWLFTTADIMNAVLPRTKDLDKLTTKLMVEDMLGKAERRQAKVDKLTYPPWGEVLGVSGAYIFIFLGLACLRFTYRDY